MKYLKYFRLAQFFIHLKNTNLPSLFANQIRMVSPPRGLPNLFNGKSNWIVVIFMDSFSDLFTQIAIIFQI